MADVFLSYVRSDASKAKQIADALSARGWSVWWDTQLTPGVRFRDKIAEELHAARCVVVLWSKASLKSDFVIDEADDGKRRGVLVQALIEDVLPPHGFRQIQAASLTEWDGTDSGEFARLCNGVSTFAPSSRSPERPQAPEAPRSPGLTSSTRSDAVHDAISRTIRNYLQVPQKKAAQWRELKERFNSLGDAKLQADIRVGFKALSPPGDQTSWTITGSERSKFRFQLFAEDAGQLLRGSPQLHRDEYVYKFEINRWLSFVDERGSRSGRIDDLVKASVDACAYCEAQEIEG